MPHPDPVRITADDPSVPGILDLVQRSFAYMEPRIDPPSSMHRLSVDSIQDECVQGEVWAIEQPAYACVFLTEKDDCLYIGKLAVSETMRGQGLARRLIDLAANRARAKRLQMLELSTRIELVENHHTFSRLGFLKTGEDRHAGYERPTFIIMRKPVEADPD